MFMANKNVPIFNLDTQDGYLSPQTLEAFKQAVASLHADGDSKLRLLSANDAAIVYSGTWTKGPGSTYSTEVDASAEITFTGSQFQWYGVKGADHGVAELSIDGNPPEAVDCYSPERMDTVLCYRKNDLILQKHTVRITIAHRTNPAARGRYIEIKRVVLMESASPGKEGLAAQRFRAEATAN